MIKQLVEKKILLVLLKAKYISIDTLSSNFKEKER